MNFLKQYDFCGISFLSKKEQILEFIDYWGYFFKIINYKEVNYGNFL